MQYVAAQHTLRFRSHRRISPPAAARVGTQIAVRSQARSLWPAARARPLRQSRDSGSQPPRKMCAGRSGCGSKSSMRKAPPSRRAVPRWCGATSAASTHRAIISSSSTWRRRIPSDASSRNSSAPIGCCGARWRSATAASTARANFRHRAAARPPWKQEFSRARPLLRPCQMSLEARHRAPGGVSGSMPSIIMWMC